MGNSFLSYQPEEQEHRNLGEGDSMVIKGLEQQMSDSQVILPKAGKDSLPPCSEGKTKVTGC